MFFLYRKQRRHEAFLPCFRPKRIIWHSNSFINLQGLHKKHNRCISPPSHPYMYVTSCKRTPAWSVGLLYFCLTGFTCSGSCLDSQLYMCCTAIGSCGLCCVRGQRTILFSTRNRSIQSVGRCPGKVHLTLDSTSRSLCAWFGRMIGISWAHGVPVGCECINECMQLYVTSYLVFSMPARPSRIC